MGKVRVPKSVRNTVLSIVALLILFPAAGIGYTWYMGQYGDNDVAVAPPPAKKKVSDPFGEPPKPAANAAVSASVQVLTSPVAPGENASMTVKTLPGAKCTIEVVYGEVPSTDSGLKEKTADEYGVISWSWTVEPAVPVGTWPVEVTCKNGEKSAMVRGDLVVARQ